MFLLAFYLVLAAGLCALWYWLWMRHRQRRAGEIARWIQSAISGQGCVLGIRWLSAATFRVPLRLTRSPFHNASVKIEMAPHGLPVRWLMSKFRKEQETLIFQADLDLPPSFALHLQNFRWFARSSRKPVREDQNWQIHRADPIIISTRLDWQREVSDVMVSLAESEPQDFLRIDFQRRSPHFSVKLPLEAIAPGAPGRSYVLDSMKELASRSANIS
ncbi:MAG TPA: hypothetical protein VE783_01600 [Candidatus Limnocylindrales bacterium]|nr:hypothetical protein [Candidatus Limnocylindrales bacterium]